MASPAGQKNVFRFGLFEADPASGQLLKQGEHVRFQDQPFRMLILLLERRGEVVTREELREKLWPQNTFVEFDNGLNVAVKKIRDALSDTAENPRFVETVPRRGYRFIAPVSVKVLEPSPRPQTPSPSPESDRRAPASHRRKWFAYGSAAVLIVAAVVAVMILSRANLRKVTSQPTPTETGPAITPRRTVAVLEFQNVKSHPADDWLSTAIAEMLTTELGAGEKLHLVPAEDVSRMKSELHLSSSSSLARETAIAAAKNLKADMLVLGSFTAIGTGGNRRVRIDVRMQDAADGDIVAEVAETAPEEQLFELVSRAGTRLREALGLPGITLTEQAAARATLPSNAVASRLYAEGLARLRVLDAAGARDLLVQAIEAEPKFPLSHMALASAWRALGYDQKARAEAKTALELSASLPRSDRLLIEGRFHEMNGEMDQAISAYRALFTLFPDSLEDGLMLAEAQNWAGKSADALATLDALRRLPEPLSQDPRIDLRNAAALGMQGSSGGMELIHRGEAKARAQGMSLIAAKAQIMECSALITIGKYEDALQPCGEAHSAFTAAGNHADRAQAGRFLGDIRQHQGRLDEALEWYREVLSIDRMTRNDRGIAVSANEMALVYEDRGDLRRAEKLYRESYLLFLKVGHRKNASILAHNVGGVLLQRGQLAEAEKLFQEAAKLAREVGAKDAEASAERTIAELALLRGNLEIARQHAEGSYGFDLADPFGRVDDLDRLSRIQAAQGDLAGARQRRLEALSVAESVGAKGLAAQSRRELAELDLEEGRLPEAEQSLRATLLVFRSEKMRDDELQAVFALVRCLLMQGKAAEARVALNEIREAVSRSENPSIRLLFAIVDARAKAAATTSSSARHSAKAELLGAAIKAGSLGLVPLQYEARLALGEIEIQDNLAAGQDTLAALEKEAHVRGLELIARKAARIRARS